MLLPNAMIGLSFILSLFLPAIPVTVGLTQALYTVGESSGSITVCYEILSGRTATRSIYMTIQTVQGDAIGIK